MSAEGMGFPGTTRRRFLAASGAAVLATGVNVAPTAADSAAPFVRKSLTDPSIGPVLDSYKKAITAMLNLPPTDPRNWYRIAFIHELDCPHANWWFLPWHRGYIGWFEAVCRDLSGDPTFALPYWDWTAKPAFPAQFSDSSVLNPQNPAFFAKKTAFLAAFADPVKTLYQGFSPAQLAQLNLRGMNTAASLTAQINGDFFGGTASRDPNFNGAYRTAVSSTTLRAALKSTKFSVPQPAPSPSFASDPATAHSDSSGEGILESQPHDHVHGSIGGLMGQFLSPVDPIFWMHHSNLDRIWDVWTRKQQKLHLPILPQGAALATWQNEPFLFYVDGQGHPSAKVTAGDYAATSVFNYVYTKGSGEEVLLNAAPLASAVQAPFALTRSVLDFGQPTIGSASVPAESMQTVGVTGGRDLIARISLELPGNHAGLRFHVLVNPPEGVTNVSFNDPSFAGSITPFGSHGDGGGHAMGRSISFDIPLTEAIKNLREADRWDDTKPIRIQVVPDSRGVTMRAFSVPIKSISLITL
jgi:tyrosinase